MILNWLIGNGRCNMERLPFKHAIKAIWEDKGLRSPLFISQLLITGGFVALRSLDVMQRGSLVFREYCQTEAELQEALDRYKLTRKEFDWYMACTHPFLIPAWKRNK